MMREYTVSKKFPWAYVGPDGDNPFAEQLRLHTRSVAETMNSLLEGAFDFLIRKRRIDPQRLCTASEHGVPGSTAILLDASQELGAQVYPECAVFEVTLKSEFDEPRMLIECRWLVDPEAIS